MRSIFASFVCATTLFAAVVSAAEPGQRAPGFALMDIKGEVHDLYDFHGKPVIVEFMQTTCAHCQAFVDALEKVQAKYGDKVGILAIANPPDTMEKVGAFISAHNIQYPIVFDMGQAAYSYVRKQTFDLPQVYLIDANGIIFNHYGYSALTKDIFEGNGLMGEIDRLLAGSKPPAPAAKKAAPKAAPKK